MTETVRELIGVYDADGTLLGEARYWIGARLGPTDLSTPMAVSIAVSL